VLDARPAGVAAAVATLALGALPALPLLAIRLGKLPMPALPSSAEDLVRDQPMPPKKTINALVIRSDQLLTGMLLGTALVAAVSELVLAADGGVSEVLLTSIVAVAYLLRARIFPTVRQRLPLLAAGLVGLSALALGSGVLEPPLPLVALLPGLVFVATLVAAAGLTYSRRQPSPYLGRFADIFDVLLLVLVVPVACSVLGLFGFARGIAG
jgi:type VII secretion integral membrane protein EccD